MGTTVDKLNRVLATKNELKAALIEKGQDPGDVFSQYPEKIRAIQTDSIKLSSIEITKQSNKIAYTAFESFNPNGMGVEANYSNGAHKSLMPNGYKRVEYIEGTGTQFINTDFVYGPDNYQNVRMVADSTVGTAENGWAVSGIGAGVNFYYGCGRGGVIYYGCGGADSSTGASYTYNRAIWDLDSKSASYKVTEKDSGIRLVNTSISVGTPTGDGSLFLFAYRQAGSNVAMCHIETLYGCKIYEGGVLARDFIPCINPSGEAGLFDLANNQFYGNAGSGAFIAGPELSSDGYEVTDGNSLTADQNHVTISYTEYGVTKTISQEVSVQTIAVNVPSVNESFTYTGSVLTPTWSNYDSSIMTIGGNTSGTGAGTYTATFALKDKVNYRWSDGSTSDKSVNWTIGKASVAIPAANSTSFTYNGSAATLSLNNYDSALVSASGISATNAGNYTATFALKDSNNYQWSDGTTANKTIAWVINKASVSIPTANATSFTYTGSALAPTWTGYDSSIMSISGDASGTNAGSYTTTFVLKDKTNYQWSDGTTSDKSISWTVGKAQASITLNKNSVTLNASKLTDTVTITSVGMDSVTATSSNTGVATVSKSGNTLTISSVNKTTGQANITISGVVNSSYNAPKYPSITVEASFITFVEVPYQSGSLYYTGSSLSPTWANYDSSQLTIGGTTSAVDIGAYTATFAPKSGCAWKDGTTTAKIVEWRITDNWPEVLKDFKYTENSDGTATITDWKKTYNGASSTELIIPDNPRIIL